MPSTPKRASLRLTLPPLALLASLAWVWTGTVVYRICLEQQNKLRKSVGDNPNDGWLIPRKDVQPFGLSPTLFLIFALKYDRLLAFAILVPVVPDKRDSGYRPRSKALLLHISAYCKNLTNLRLLFSLHLHVADESYRSLRQNREGFPSLLLNLHPGA